MNCLLKCFNNENRCFRLVNIENNGTYIYADLEYMKRRCSWSYMDEELRTFCTELALFLREETGKNCFFDIENGKFKLIL